MIHRRTTACVFCGSTDTVIAGGHVHRNKEEIIAAFCRHCADKDCIVKPYKGCEGCYGKWEKWMGAGLDPILEIIKSRTKNDKKSRNPGVH